jgi:hypothetical protein
LVSFFLRKIKSGRINAVALASWRWAIRKNMPKMGIAFGTTYFDSDIA